MSVITPIPQDTSITLYRGVPWDNTYSDIRLFDTQAERDSFFSNNVMGYWENCSVVNYEQRVRLQTDNFNYYLTADYMSFVNNIGVPQKRFYAFVTSVSYINVNTIEVAYEIDWVQTYLFDFGFGECLVEREHVLSDKVGEHTVPENFEIGEYTIRHQERWKLTPAFLIATLPEDPNVANINNVVTCADFTQVQHADDTELIKVIIDRFNDTPERVVMTQMAVAEMSPNSTALAQHVLPRQTGFAFNGDTYVPQNGKLNTFPYRVITVDNFMGDMEQYRWENFADTQRAHFVIEGTAVPKPIMECFPIDYMGAVVTDVDTNRVQQQSVVYDNFPMCPYANDTFRAWVSQYGATASIKAAASVVTGTAGLAASIATGNPIGIVASSASLVSNVTNEVQDYKDHKLHSTQMHGGISTAGLNYARDEVGFRATEYAIRPEYARRIDKFFTRYGYRVDCTKIPNIRGRQFLNYVKCNRVNIYGQVPVEARNTMERALLNGTTFWHINNMGSEINSNPIL